LEERLEVETSHVNVNKAWFNWAMTLTYVTAWEFAISAEAMKLLPDASALHSIMLQSIDYVHHLHFIQLFLCFKVIEFK